MLLIYVICIEIRLGYVVRIGMGVCAYISNRLLAVHLLEACHIRISIFLSLMVGDRCFTLFMSSVEKLRNIQKCIIHEIWKTFI